jgi:hypothetical protein
VKAVAEKSSCILTENDSLWQHPQGFSQQDFGVEFILTDFKLLPQ